MSCPATYLELELRSDVQVVHDLTQYSATERTSIYHFSLSQIYIMSLKIVSSSPIGFFFFVCVCEMITKMSLVVVIIISFY